MVTSKAKKYFVVIVCLLMAALNIPSISTILPEWLTSFTIGSVGLSQALAFGLGVCAYLVGTGQTE